jgi:hypothetical protein
LAALTKRLAVLGLFLLTSVVELDLLRAVLESTKLVSAAFVLLFEELLPSVGKFWKPVTYASMLKESTQGRVGKLFLTGAWMRLFQSDHFRESQEKSYITQ